MHRPRTASAAPAPASAAELLLEALEPAYKASHHAICARPCPLLLCCCCAAPAPAPPFPSTDCTPLTPMRSPCSACHVLCTLHSVPYVCLAP